MGEKLSDCYYKRQDCMQKNEFPAYSTVRENLGNCLGEVCIKSLRRTRSKEQKLQGPGADLWVSPSDHIAGLVRLKKPLTIKHAKALTHEGIIEIGGKLEEKLFKSFENEKQKVLAENDEVWKLIVDAECKKAVERAKLEEQDSCQKHVNAMAIEFEKLHESSLQQLQENFQKEATEVLNETILKIEEKMKKQTEKDLCKQEVKLRNTYNMKMQREIAKLEDDFNKMLQNERMKSMCLLRKVHRDGEDKIQTIYSQLEKWNIASLMFTVCNERKKCHLEKAKMADEYMTEIRSLSSSLTEKEKLIEKIKSSSKQADILDTEWKAKVREVVKQFKIFTTFCLRGVPEQTEFLVNFEQALFLQMKDATEKIKFSKQVIQKNNDIEDDVKYPEKSPAREQDTNKKPFVIYGEENKSRGLSNRQTNLSLEMHGILSGNTNSNGEDMTGTEGAHVTDADGNCFIDADGNHCVKSEKSACHDDNTCLDAVPEKITCYGDNSCRKDKQNGGSAGMESTNGDKHSSNHQSIGSRKGCMKCSAFKMISFTGNCNCCRESPGPSLAAKESIGILGVTDSKEITSSTKLLTKQQASKNSLKGCGILKSSISPGCSNLCKLANGASSSDQLAALGILGSTDSLETAASTKLKIKQSENNTEGDSCKSNANSKNKSQTLSCQKGKRKSISAKSTFDVRHEEELKISPNEEELLAIAKGCDSNRAKLLEYLKNCTLENCECAQLLGDKDDSAIAIAKDDSDLPRKKEMPSVNTVKPCECEVPSVKETTTQTSNPDTSQCLSSDADSKDKHANQLSKTPLDHITPSKLFDVTVDFNRFALVGEDAEKLLNYNIEEFTTKRINSIHRIIDAHPSLANLFLPENNSF